MTVKPIVIAIDGPAASGKGTVAKRIAAHYGLPYLDTGALYRAVGYRVLQNEQDPSDVNAACEAVALLSEAELQNPDLHTEAVGSAASQVAAIPAVRAALLQFQQDFADSTQGAVLDGRDIGTVICPDADYKFFITADVQTRADRRYKQLQNKDSSIIYQAVLDDLKRRDARDSEREIAPLTQAQDAITIDTTHLTIDEVVATVLAAIE